MALNRAAIRSQVHKAADAIVGMAYKEVPQEWRPVFQVLNNDQAYVEEVMMTGLGAAPTRNEGDVVFYDDAREAWTARYVHEEVAMAFKITQQAVEDSQYIQVTTRLAQALGRSFAHTKNAKCAAVLNNAFTAGATAGGDGAALCSASHPTVSDGNQSNILATPADLSETSIEALVNQIKLAKDDRGLNVMLMPKMLIIHTNEEFNANRILQSAQRSGTADNDTNALRNMGTIPIVHPMRYLTDTDAWFIKTDCPDGLKYFQRIEQHSASSGDFDTDDYKFRRRERYSAGWTDWRTLWASSGA